VFCQVNDVIQTFKIDKVVFVGHRMSFLFLALWCSVRNT